MEEQLKTWKEKLEVLNKGKSIVLKEDESSQTIYSAIRDNADTFKDKKFSIRTHPQTLKKSVIRIK